MPEDHKTIVHKIVFGVPRLRSSTKAAIAGGASLAAMHTPALSALPQINDWESLIVLVITWFVSRLTKSPMQPGRL